jgi:hypothetical protein
VSSCPDGIDDKTSNEDLTKTLIYLIEQGGHQQTHPAQREAAKSSRNVLPVVGNSGANASR